MALIIRTMKREELDLAVLWAKEEGWNPGVYDAECFWAADPNGFFIAMLDDQPVGVMSMVKYGTDYAFGGLYIVKKEYRGMGYGMSLTKTVLEYAGNRNVGGDSVIENVDMYAKFGMKLAHGNARLNLLSSKVIDVPAYIKQSVDIPFEMIRKYDEEVFGFDRKEFLKLWISRPETVAFVAVGSVGEVVGYGVIRKCYTGYKIGPLFADNKALARDLFLALIGAVPGKSEVSWDVSEECALVPELVKKFDMEKVFATGRMYLKGQPEFPLEKWFGITSFELG